MLQGLVAGASYCVLLASGLVFSGRYRLEQVLEIDGRRRTAHGFMVPLAAGVERLMVFAPGLIVAIAPLEEEQCRWLTGRN